MNEKPSNDPAELIQHYYEGLRPGADDVQESTGLVPLGAVRRALDDALDDTLLGGGNADEIRAAIAQALVLSECRQSWREQLVGAGLNSVAGKRVLSACRHAVHALELDVIVRDVRHAHAPEEAEQVLAARLDRIDRDARAELESSVPDLFEAYLVESSAATAVWLLPTDPSGAPRFWNSRTQRFEIEPRASRDWMVAHLGELFGGSAWRKRRAGTFNTIAEATSWACARPGQGRDGDLFVVDPDEDG